MENREELSKAEINVYTSNCGQSRLNCMTDCVGGGPFISTAN